MNYIIKINCTCFIFSSSNVGLVEHLQWPLWLKWFFSLIVLSRLFWQIVTRDDVSQELTFLHDSSVWSWGWEWELKPRGKHRDSEHYPWTRHKFYRDPNWSLSSVTNGLAFDSVLTKHLTTCWLALFSKYNHHPAGRCQVKCFTRNPLPSVWFHLILTIALWKQSLLFGRFHTSV